MGEEQLDKILEESSGVGAGGDLEELKDKLTRAGKKEIVTIRRRADRNLWGAEHYESILSEKWRVNTMEKVKENIALSGSSSNGVEPCQEQMNRTAANRGVCSELNAYAQQLHEQLIDPGWS